MSDVRAGFPKLGQGVQSLLFRPVENERYDEYPELENIVPTYPELKEYNDNIESKLHQNFRNFLRENSSEK